MRLNLLILMILSVLTCSMTVLATAELEQTGGYVTHGYREDNSNMKAVSSSFNPIYANEMYSRNVSGSGYNTFPLVADVDDDGLSEIFTTNNGNYVRVFNADPDTGVLLKVAEYNIGANASGYPMELAQNGTNTFLLIRTDTTAKKVVVLKYNESGLKPYATLNGTFHPNISSLTTISNIKCTSVAPDTDGDVCFFGANTKIYEYYLTNNTINFYSTATTNIMAKEVAIADIDNDGYPSVFFIGNRDSDVYEDVIEWDYHSKSLGTIFKYEPGSTSSMVINDVVVKDIDSGYQELMYTYRQVYTGGAPVPERCGIRVFNSDGTANSIQPGTTYVSGGPSCINYELGVSDVYLPDSGIWYKIACQGMTAPGAITKCYELSASGSLISSLDGTAIFTMADWSNGSLDSDDVNPSLFGSSLIVSTSIIGYNTSYSSLIYPVFTDITGDNVPEIVSQESTALMVSYQNYSNEPPTLNNSLQGGGYTGYFDGAVCVGTAINFQAIECFSGTSENCNYYNDIETDLEFIRSNCGIDGEEIKTGENSSVNPEFSCYYGENDTGIHLVTLYLTDTQNPDNYEIYNIDPILILVIDGIPGDTCNRAIDFVTSTSDLERIQTEEESARETQLFNSVNELTNTLSFSNPAIKFIFVIMILMASAGAGAKLAGNNNPGSSTFGIILGAGLGTLVCLKFKLIEVWTLLLIFVIIIFAFILAKTMFKQSAEGGG